MPHLYHEVQVAALCGQHCLNNLLQGPFFTEIDLGEIAQQLDQQERALLDATERRTYQSANVDESGNFSIQVLSTALSNMFGLVLEDTRRPENRAAMQRPEAQQGFVLNRSAHWYCLRKIDGQWWSCNSTRMAPEKITASGNFSGLATELRNLASDDWTVFLVKGDKWPPPARRNEGAPAKNWVDPANPPRDPNDELAFGNAAPRKEEPKVVAFSGAGRTLGGGGSGGGAPRDTSSMSEDEQLAMALSLSQELAQQARMPSEPLTLDEGAPMTTLQVRMADGSRKVIKANHTHTVQQLKQHVATFAPGVAFTLKGGFPPKPLDDEDATLAEAKLLGESLVFSPS